VKPETHEAVRLQKILSTAGVASRRASEQLILEGRVTVNGAVVRELGTRADPGHDDIRVDGRRIRTDVRQRYILLHKPRGYVTTRRDPEGRPTVLDLLGRHVGYIYPVGRLDYDSEGLLLMTTDGALAEQLTHPRHSVERVYEVIVLGAPDDAAIEKLRRGVYLDGRRTSGAEVRRGQTVKSSDGITTRLVMTLFEGRNRQVRRMCQAVGHPVRSLTRVSMGPLTLGRLRPGEWRDLTVAEVAALRHPDRRRNERPAEPSHRRREDTGARRGATGSGSTREARHAERRARRAGDRERSPRPKDGAHRRSSEAPKAERPPGARGNSPRSKRGPRPPKRR